jgi:predicted RNA-binding protein with PIN domain
VGQRRTALQSQAEVRLDLLRPALEAAYAQARRDLKAHPPIEPPSEMQAFLRFRKFPARALRAAESALESEDFRESVLDGTAKDVAGPASLLLTRPEGWQDKLESVVAMEVEIASEQADDVAIRELTQRLDQAEGGLYDAQQTAEQALEQQTVLEAESAADRETAETALRDLQASEQQVAELQRRVSELSQRATKAEQNLGAERGRVKELEDELQTRLAIVEPAAEAVVEPLPVIAAEVPEQPSIDRDRLAASMAVAAEAAAQMSRALAEMSDVVEPAVEASGEEPSKAELPPVVRPPRTARRIAVPLPRAMLEDSDEATDYLLRMPGLELFVDGYNITLQAWPKMQLPEQRQRLISAFTSICASTKASVRIVFDGAEGEWPSELPARCPVTVQFAPATIEADDVILDHLARLGPATPVAVVSSDRRVQDGARKLGAYVISSEQMRRRL